MGVFELVPHPDWPPSAVDYLTVDVRANGRWLWPCWVIGCPTERLELPSPAKPYRTNELWRSTCFELFIPTGAETYLEYNFAPSSQWAKYSFSGYRTDMHEAPAEEPPVLRLSDEGYALIVSAQLDYPDPNLALVGLSAVIEETDGTKSYWALSHPPGPPDFHNRECWTAPLPAPDRS